MSTTRESEQATTIGAAVPWEQDMWNEAFANALVELAHLMDIRIEEQGPEGPAPWLYAVRRRARFLQVRRQNGFLGRHDDGYGRFDLSDPEQLKQFDTLKALIDEEEAP